MAKLTVNVPAKITITNNSSKVERFIPKGENFQVTIAAGDSVEFIVDSAEQVLYYLGQANGKLAVTQAEVEVVA